MANMAQDRAALESLIAEEERKLLRIKQGVRSTTDWLNDPQVQSSFREIERLKKALEHPEVESRDTTISTPQDPQMESQEEQIERGRKYVTDKYDSKPELPETVVSEPEFFRFRIPLVAAPDLAVPGERVGLDPSDHRYRRTSDRDVNQQEGQALYEQDIARLEAERVQQQRSPTAVHGGTRNLNARFAPGSSLGAKPDDLPWDRPTQTDPDAPPTGIVPGDRPIRRPTDKEGTPSRPRLPTMADSAPGQGEWLGHMRKSKMDERVDAAMAGKGAYADAARGTSRSRVRAIIEQGDLDRQDNQRAIRMDRSARRESALKGLEEKRRGPEGTTGYPTGPRTQGIQEGLPPIPSSPAEPAETSAGTGPDPFGGGLASLPPQQVAQRPQPPRRGSREALRDQELKTLRQSGITRGGSRRRQQQQQQQPLPGYDQSVYDDLLRRDSTGRTALQYVQNLRAEETRRRERSQDRGRDNLRDTLTAGDRKRTSDETERHHKETEDAGDADRDLRDRAISLQEDESKHNKKKLDDMENTPGRKREKRQDARKSYINHDELYDPEQEGETDWLPWSGVKEWNKDHWEDVVKLKDSDPSTQQGKFDNEAYSKMKAVFKSGDYRSWWLDDNAEDYADHLHEKRDTTLGLPGWMTRSHMIHAYAHFATGKATLPTKTERDKSDRWADWSGSTPEDADFD